MSGYQLVSLEKRFLFGRSPGVLLLEDSEATQRPDLNAHVKSGDYFSLLATQLDEVSQFLGTTQEAQIISLQHIIDDLLYLQRHYEIRKKLEKHP